MVIRKRCKILKRFIDYCFILFASMGVDIMKINLINRKKNAKMREKTRKKNRKKTKKIIFDSPEM